MTSSSKECTEVGDEMKAVENVVGGARVGEVESGVIVSVWRPDEESAGWRVGRREARGGVTHVLGAGGDVVSDNSLIELRDCLVISCGEAVVDTLQLRVKGVAGDGVVEDDIGATVHRETYLSERGGGET